METISYDDFLRVDMRVGTVVRVAEFPKARHPAYKLWIDFGPLGERKSSARITRLYRPQDLVGHMVVAVVNFPPRQIADFMSEVLVLGVVEDDEAVVLLQPGREATPGRRIL